jgi:YebC/PmpR family DNA-binding regulatory protein
MSGHSKWATIKRKKAITDSKRSAVFTKLIREITVAAKTGGPDPDSNARLRLAIFQARKSNVPKDVIERAINKAGGSDAANYQETVYEGYAAGGVALMIECATDNTNRTVANLRAALTRGGGSLGTSGSVGYMFERKGVFEIPVAGIADEDDFIMAIIDAGAEDVEKGEEFYTVTCAFENFGAINAKLEALKIEPESSTLQRIPTNTLTLDVENAQKVLKLIEKLEEDDDVQHVFHNMELTEELMQAL